MEEILSKEIGIIKGVVANRILTNAYGFKDIKLKQKTLSDYLECQTNEIQYDRARNRFIFMEEQYHVLCEDELAVQKIINIRDTIKFKTFFMKPYEISDMLHMTRSEVERIYNVRESSYDHISAADVFSRSNISLESFISKMNNYYANSYFLSYDCEETIINGLYLYLYGV